MPAEFLEKVARQLQGEGYLVEASPGIPGLQTGLYARSARRFRLGFAQVEDHFLFVDWETSGSSSLDRLLEIYRHLSSLANQNFPVPHALRMQIPNLVVAAFTGAAFPQDVALFVRTTYLNPWYGGETGQVILVEIENRRVITHFKPGRRQPGAFPLAHAAQVIQSICQKAFPQG
jgi:hypothetical protein